MLIARSRLALENILDDEIDQLVLKHGLRMEVGDEERDIVTLTLKPPRS